MDAVDREERLLILESRVHTLENLTLEQASVIKRLLDADAKPMSWISRVKEILDSAQERINEARKRLR